MFSDSIFIFRDKGTEGESEKNMKRSSSISVIASSAKSIVLLDNLL